MILSVGAAVNIILNYYLIKFFGIKEAAFSTLMSYIVSTFLLGYICLKKELLIMNKRFYIISLLLFINILINFFFQNLVYVYSFISILILILIIKFYYEDLKILVENFIKKE